MISIWVLNGLIYAGLGLFAGLMAGILGIGGGIIVVPGLVYLFQMNQTVPSNSLMQMAAGTSLAVIICTAQASFRAHQARESIVWAVYKRLLPGILLGALAGSILASFVPTEELKILFALFLLALASKIVFYDSVKQVEHIPKAWINGLVSFFIGLKSGLFGVGGGLLTIPYLTHWGVPLRKIPAISNLCSMAMASVGTVIFIITGWNAMATIPYATGYVYWPAVFWIALFSSIIAPWGARLNYLLPTNYLRGIFIVILIFTAISII